MDLSIRVEFSYHRHIYTICFTLTIIFLSNSKVIILIRVVLVYHYQIDSTFVTSIDLILMHDNRIVLSTGLFIFFEDFRWISLIFILTILVNNKWSIVKKSLCRYFNHFNWIALHSEDAFYVYTKRKLFSLEFYSNISVILTLFDIFLCFPSLRIAVKWLVTMFSSIILFIFIYVLIF